MRGIDVSRWNGWPFNAVTEKAYKESDFVICKATQGTSYQYTQYFKKAIDRAIADGKLVGAYHYASGQGTPVQEADYFVSIVKPYLGKIVLALDWENGYNKAWGNTTWAKKFIDRVKSKTGIQCFLYTGMTGIKQCTNVATEAPLWFAGYPTTASTWSVPAWPTRYNISPYKAYTIWQYTSGGGIDRNTTKMTKADWNKYAGAKSTTPTTKPTTTPTTKPSTDISKLTTLQLVYNTMKGMYGTGTARKNALGKRYSEVQSMINHINRALVGTLAKEVIQGKYGNGDTRKVVLGKRYDAVQKKVNQMAKK